MTKKKQRNRLKKVGRKPVPLKNRHWWTLSEIRERCGAEDDDECWDHYTGMYGNEPKSEHMRRYPAVVQGGLIKVMLRRLAWFLAFGEDPPEGMLLVMAKCNNPRCQNPFHAKPMWEAQKCQRAAAKGNFSSLARKAKIAAGKQAIGKLDWDKVDEIRSDNTPWRERPWKKWGVSETTWKRVRAHKTWVRYDCPMARMAA